MEVDLVERLVLVEATEDESKLLAGNGVDMPLQALRADLLHHALHRRVDRADGGMFSQKWLQQTMARSLDGGHHSVGADHYHMPGAGERHYLLAEGSLRERQHRLEYVSTEVAILLAPW